MLSVSVVTLVGHLKLERNNLITMRDSADITSRAVRNAVIARLRNINITLETIERAMKDIQCAPNSNNSSPN